MSHNDNVDNLIIRRLQERAKQGAKKTKLCDIFGAEVRQEAERVGEETGSEPFRVVDRRLQALRKKGLIQFNSADGWSLKNA